MITTNKEASSSKTYAEQVLRGLDALDAKLKGCDGDLQAAIETAFGVSADYYSLAWIVSRQELAVLVPRDGVPRGSVLVPRDVVSPGAYCTHINCEELIVLANTRLLSVLSTPVGALEQIRDLETLRQKWLRILFSTDSEFDLLTAVAEGVLPSHLLTNLQLRTKLVHEMVVVLRNANAPEYRDVYWSPTYCSTVTDAILAYLDHLQSSGNIAPSSIRGLINFHAWTLIGNLEANSAPGLQLIKDRLSQLSEEP